MNNQKITKQIQDGFMNAFNFSGKKVETAYDRAEAYVNNFNNRYKSDVEFNETEVMEDNQEIIEKIHNEFMTAGDNLLQEAEHLIATTKASKPERAKNLHSLGFMQTRDAKEHQTVLDITTEKGKIAEAIMSFKIKYPNYKFISKEDVNKICKKYNLVLGTVNNFIGFVPDKNIQEINKFFELHQTEKTEFTHTYSHSINGVWHRQTMYLTKKNCEGLNGKKSDEHEQNTLLKICAPISDMKLNSDEEVKNHQISKKVYPDPVVLKGVAHDNMVWGYLILTAWGDEASDELVINQNNN